MPFGLSLFAADVLPFNKRCSAEPVVERFFILHFGRGSGGCGRVAVGSILIAAADDDDDGGGGDIT